MHVLIGRTLGGALDGDAFAELSGTVSLPFAAESQNRVAVKVIDPRGTRFRGCIIGLKE